VLAADKISAWELSFRNRSCIILCLNGKPSTIAAQLSDWFEVSANRIRDGGTIVLMQCGGATRFVDIQQHRSFL
jgi:hypothetical protein